MHNSIILRSEFGYSLILAAHLTAIIGKCSWSKQVIITDNVFVGRMFETPDMTNHAINRNTITVRLNRL